MPRSRKSLWRLLAVVLALGMVAAACGSDDDNGDDNASGDNGGSAKYSIAFVGPKTGDAANLGINILNGAKLAVKQWNAANPDLQITLKEFDTQGAEGQAPGQFAKYNADSSILGIVGPAFSGETKAVLPNLQNAGLVMVSSSATNAALPTLVTPDANGYSVFHRALADDAAQAAGIAKFLKAKYAGKSVFYIDDNTEYGKGLADELASAAAANGNPTKGSRAKVDPTKDVFTDAVNAAAQAKADIIFYGGYYEEAGQLKKQLFDKPETKDTLFISGDGALDPGFITNAGPGATNVAITCPCNLATESASGALGQFAKDYKEEFNTDSGTYSAEAFDAANILMNGIKAGNTTRAKLLAYVENLPSYDGISKKIEFEQNGNLKATGVYLFQVKDGKFAPLADTNTL